MGEPAVVRPWTRESLTHVLESELVPECFATEQPLPSERALSEGYGVSRSLIREVLRGLEQRGLVEILPGKGAYARRPPAIDDARSLRQAWDAGSATDHDPVEARIALESHAVHLAAGCATRADLEAIGRALSAMDAASDEIDQVVADICFHVLLVQSARNPLLSAMHDMVSVWTLEAMLRCPAHDARPDSLPQLHRAVLEAITGGCGPAAQESLGAVLALERAWTSSANHSQSASPLADGLRHRYGQARQPADVLARALLAFTPPTLTPDRRRRKVTPA